MRSLAAAVGGGLADAPDGPARPTTAARRRPRARRRPGQTAQGAGACLKDAGATWLQAWYVESETGATHIVGFRCVRDVPGAKG